tara:strand:- start:2993 stop:3511 length:519 start_codon:yes stop_codon:yes gene_type:complete
MEELKSLIRDIPDFPKPGIIFKDITPVLSNWQAFINVTNALCKRYQGKKIDVVAGIEARGFLFAGSLAYALNSGLVPIRKPGKLPFKTFRTTYALEYGEDTIEIHQDAIQPGQNILLIDDVLATGGTAAAAVDLIKNNFHANIVEASFVIELDFLKGREKLKDVPAYSLIHY